MFGQEHMVNCEEMPLCAVLCYKLCVGVKGERIFQASSVRYSRKEVESEISRF